LIPHGGLPVDQVLRYGREIADAPAQSFLIVKDSEAATSSLGRIVRASPSVLFLSETLRQKSQFQPDCA
jgi:hypothetical protein